MQGVNEGPNLGGVSRKIRRRENIVRRGRRHGDGRGGIRKIGSKQGRKQGYFIGRLGQAQKQKNAIDTRASSEYYLIATKLEYVRVRGVEKA